VCVCVGGWGQSVGVQGCEEEWINQARTHRPTIREKISPEPCGQCKQVVGAVAPHLPLHHAKLKPVLVKVTEGATVRVASARSVGHDDLHARVRRVVGSLALLAVVVSDVVRVRFLKLVHPHGLAKLSAPKQQRFLQTESDTFEEETVLHPPTVLDVVVLDNVLVRVTHAHGKRLGCELVHGCGCDGVDGLVRLVPKVVAQVPATHHARSMAWTWHVRQQMSECGTHAAATTYGGSVMKNIFQNNRKWQHTAQSNKVQRKTNCVTERRPCFVQPVCGARGKGGGGGHVNKDAVRNREGVRDECDDSQGESTSRKQGGRQRTVSRGS
jgi:hypothetical protein